MSPCLTNIVASPVRQTVASAKVPRHPGLESAEQSHRGLGRKIQTLIIEDNEDLARLFADLLEVLGCSVSVAWKGDSGLAMAEQRIPNIVFCDVNMPGDKNGLDVARELRANVDFDDTWLIAITGFNDPDSVEEARVAGFDRVFGKPIKFAQLKEIVESYSAAWDIY